MTYKHAEAFCLMAYACDCGARETIWNSRDGVTPLGGVYCSSCGYPTMQHVDWNADRPDPSHKLYDGQRFFRDGTADEAVALTQRRIDAAGYRGRSAKHMLDDARNLTGEWHKGWPTIERWSAPAK